MRPSFPAPTPQQARILWLSLTALAVGILAFLFGGLVWGLGKVLNLLAPVLWPLAIAGVIAYILDPVVDWLEQRKIPRRRGILLVFFVVVMLVLTLLAGILPRLIFEARVLVANIPSSSELQERVAKWMSQSPWRFKIPFLRSTSTLTNSLSSSGATNAIPPITNVLGGIHDTNAALTNRIEIAGSTAQVSWEGRIARTVVTWLTAVLPKVGGWILNQIAKVASLAGLVIGLFLVPVYCFYFLQEKKGIQKKWTNYLPVTDSRFKDEVVFILTSINDYLIVFFRGQVVVAACDGVLYTLGFFLIGLPYALLLGIIAGALSIVPYIGAVLTIVPVIVLAAIEYHDWLHPILAVVVFATVQLLEGLVISPKIMGDRVGLHPLTIIIAVMVGTTLLGGILGGVLAIPFTAALRVLMTRYIWKKRAAAELSSRQRESVAVS